MADNHGTVREVIWQDIFPWVMLTRTVRLALSMRVLVLSAVALLGIAAGWRMIGGFFSGTDNPAVQSWIEQYDRWPWNYAAEHKLWQVGQSTLSDNTVLAEQSNAVLGHIPFVGQWLVQGSLPAAWAYLTDPFVRLFSMDVSVEGLAYLLLCCLWEVMVWAMFGGAVTRIAALDLAREERLGLFAAVGQLSRKWPTYALAVILPLIGVALIVAPFWLLGLLMKANFFVFIAGLLWFVVLLVGLFLACVLLGLLVGWPLMWPTISTERTDAFDALSRSFAYVFQRPLYYLFLVTVAALLGIVGYLVVDVFVDATIYFGNWAVSWGTGGARIEAIQVNVAGTAEKSATGLLSAGTSLIAFWTGCALIAKQAFQVGFFWCAATSIYLLMRRAVDATEIDEISVDENLTSHTLPPLSTDESGVPGIDDKDENTA